MPKKKELEGQGVRPSLCTAGQRPHLSCAHGAGIREVVPTGIYWASLETPNDTSVFHSQ